MAFLRGHCNPSTPVRRCYSGSLSSPRERRLELYHGVSSRAWRFFACNSPSILSMEYYSCSPFRSLRVGVAHIFVAFLREQCSPSNLNLECYFVFVRGFARVRVGVGVPYYSRWAVMSHSCCCGGGAYQYTAVIIRTHATDQRNSFSGRVGVTFFFFFLNPPANG